MRKRGIMEENGEGNTMGEGDGGPRKRMIKRDNQAE